MKKYVIIFEIDTTDGSVSAWSEVDKNLITTVADSTEEAIANIRMLIQDFIEHEWKEIEAWKNINVADIQFDYQYSLVSFFDAFKSLKIGEIAKLAGLNPALVRAYATGDKDASLSQVLKIESAAHNLANTLLNVKLLPRSVVATA